MQTTQTWENVLVNFRISSSGFAKENDSYWHGWAYRHRWVKLDWRTIHINDPWYDTYDIWGMEDRIGKVLRKRSRMIHTRLEVGRWGWKSEEDLCNLCTLVFFNCIYESFVYIKNNFQKKTNMPRVKYMRRNSSL